MKKYPLITLALVAAVFGASAQGLDLQSRVALTRSAMQNSGAMKTPSKEKISASGLPLLHKQGSTTLAFVALREGFTGSDLEAAGMKVLALRGDVAVVSLPTDSAASWARHPGVKKMSLERRASAKMDLGRADAGIDAIHRGEGFSLPYTGKGVLAAVVDEGIDPNHISFIGPDGKNRIKYLTYLDGSSGSQGIPNMAYYGEDIVSSVDGDGNPVYFPGVDKFTTDEAGTYHGTHTLNILGGAYTGDVELPDGAGGRSTEANPFYGVATGADLAASCGYLSDACIAWGINGILDYASYRKEQTGMPSVLSLSLGFSGGAHDPNGLMNRFLEECGEETIVVVAAGNEGDLPIVAKKNMSGGDATLTSLVYPYGFKYDPAKGEYSIENENCYYRNGAVMVYSGDERPFTINAIVLTGEPGNYRRRATLNISSEEGAYYLSDSYYANYVGGSVNSTVGRYFDGYVGGGSMYDEDLGRYYGVFDYYLFTRPENGVNEDGSEAAIVGFEIIGEDGQRIECYCDGSNTWLSDYGLEGYADGSRDGTISDMAVGHNILTVGAYTLRDSWRSLDGTVYHYENADGFRINDIGEYSSYGTMADGRTLPHVCAPGSSIISAVSRPYVETLYDGYEAFIPANFQAKATVDGKDYYWRAETGTSMSTPLVAGAIALWLEADPTLTINDVYDIIEKTSVRDEYVESGNPAQWGAGKFDALAGLKEVIARTGAGVNGVTGDGHNDRLIFDAEPGGIYTVFVGEAASLDIEVYSLAGNRVYAGRFSGNEARIDLSSLSPGIYLLKANSHVVKFVKK